MIAHLWQSTWFAVAAGLLTLLLKRNRARARYWVWFTGLVKFLVPFGILVSLGSHLTLPSMDAQRSGVGCGRWLTAMTRPAISFVMGDVAQLGFHVATSAAPKTTTDPLPVILLGIWACGFCSNRDLLDSSVDACKRGCACGFRNYRLISKFPRYRRPRSARARRVFGIFPPPSLSLLPDGMAGQLSKAEWEAKSSHTKYCHVRLSRQPDGHDLHARRVGLPGFIRWCGGWEHS